MHGSAFGGAPGLLNERCPGRHGAAGPPRAPWVNSFLRDPAVRTGYGLENQFTLASMPTVFSFGLPNDQALGKWSLNNLYFKPNVQYLYEDYSILKPFPLVYQATPFSSFRSVTGVPEAMGYVTKSITRAAGSDLRTIGSMNDRCQDMSNWGPNASHSGFL